MMCDIRWYKSGCITKIQYILSYTVLFSFYIKKYGIRLCTKPIPNITGTCGKETSVVFTFLEWEGNTVLHSSERGKNYTVINF
jgi:hypothetical protein